MLSSVGLPVSRRRIRSSVISVPPLRTRSALPTKADVRGVRKAFEEKLAGEENPVLRSLYLAVRDELTSSPSSGWKFREDLNDTIVRLEEAPPEEDPTDRLERVEADPAEQRQEVEPEVGLVAGDLPDLIPDVLQEVLGFSK